MCLMQLIQHFRVQAQAPMFAAMGIWLTSWPAQHKLGKIKIHILVD